MTIHITIKSDQRGEGKSWTAAAIAQALRDQGARVQVSDEDMFPGRVRASRDAALKGGVARPLWGKDVQITVGAKVPE